MISGVDIALWDIRGKELGLPIYQLLGGRFHDRLILYSNGWFTGCTTPEEFARAAAETVGEGHTAIKLDPFRRGHTYLSRYAALYPPEDEQQSVDIGIVAAIREAIGQGVEIFIDAHGRFDVPTAVRLANRLAPYRIGWFEEPVPPENTIRSDSSNALASSFAARCRSTGDHPSISARRCGRGFSEI